MEKKKWSNMKVIIAILVFVIAIIVTIIFVYKGNNSYTYNNIQSVEKWYQDVDEKHLVFTDDNGNGYMDNRIIILFTSTATEEQIKNAVDSVNGEIIGKSELQ